MGTKLSIITINRNNAEGLHKTIESVFKQTYTDFEYIIIDGASTDDSVEIIKQHANIITCWVSEPDKGIYNAMNKGILKAEGKYLLFLNSGDWFVDENVVGDFCKFECDEDIVSGNIIFNGNKVWNSPELKDLDFSVFFNNTLPHPGTFIKSKLFKIHGLYNENNKIISDWEFFLKCLILNKCTYCHIDRIISNFDNTGISSQNYMQNIIHQEKEVFYNREIPGIYKAFLKLNSEIDFLHSHEIDYDEYMNLKNGKFKYVIKALLFIKRKFK